MSGVWEPHDRSANVFFCCGTESLRNTITHTPATHLVVFGTSASTAEAWCLYLVGDVLHTAVGTSSGVWIGAFMFSVRDESQRNRKIPRHQQDKAGRQRPLSVGVRRLRTDVCMVRFFVKGGYSNSFLCRCAGCCVCVQRIRCVCSSK